MKLSALFVDLFELHGPIGKGDPPRRRLAGKSTEQGDHQARVSTAKGDNLLDDAWREPIRRNTDSLRQLRDDVVGVLMLVGLQIEDIA